MAVHHYILWQMGNRYACDLKLKKFKKVDCSGLTVAVVSKDTAMVNVCVLIS